MNITGFFLSILGWLIILRRWLLKAPRKVWKTHLFEKHGVKKRLKKCTFRATKSLGLILIFLLCVVTLWWSSGVMPVQMAPPQISHSPSLLATGRVGVESNTLALCQLDLHLWELSKTLNMSNLKVGKDKSIYHWQGVIYHEENCFCWYFSILFKKLVEERITKIFGFPSTW